MTTSITITTVLLCSFLLSSQFNTVESFSLNNHAAVMSPSALPTNRRQQQQITRLQYAVSDDDDDEDYDDDDDDDDDDYIDTQSLGDWRSFRMNLSIDGSVDNAEKKERKKVSQENEDLLLSQNKMLGEEYKNGVWAHPTATPEIGALVARMPMEVEIFRNYRHSIIGKKLRTILDGEDSDVGVWYARAKRLVEDEMQRIAQQADEEGQIDASELDDDFSELLGQFLENQETWQEVCLVLDKDEQESNLLVLNRPMAFKLTENLGKLCLFGAFLTEEDKKESLRTSARRSKDLVRFMMAFSSECAVYVGGPDDQGEPATLIHGIAGLPGAREISPGCGVYEGGLDAAVEGVLDGKYNPLEFRFFIGRHTYEGSALDVSVHLGKYQPIACARSLILKQCISLPKPLWNEVMELCGGELEDISTLELMNREDMKFQVVDETEYDEELFGEMGVDDDDDDFYL